MLYGSICIKQYKLMKEHKRFGCRGMFVPRFFVCIKMYISRLYYLTIAIRNVVYYKQNQRRRNYERLL